MKFKLEEKCSIYMNCKFDCTQYLSVGRRSVINSGCRIDSRGTVEIGSNVSISEDVIILTADHDIDSADFVGRNLKVTIEDYVWIGTRAMILPGVTVGRGAVIAAGAVVSKNVEPFTVVGGIPARFIKYRTSNLNYNPAYERLFQ